MKKFIIAALVVSCMFTSAAYADIIDDLTVQINASCDPNGCFPFFFDPGYVGGPGRGNADFNPLGYTWSFSFMTDNAISWEGDGVYIPYQALFGEGGQFTIDGPDNLTLSGFVTQGSAYELRNYETLDVSWFGEWSNGLYGYGIADFSTNSRVAHVYFTANVAPEPSSMALLLSGVVSCVGLLRRKLLV